MIGTDTAAGGARRPHLQQLASEHNLIAYRDPDCRDRYVLVYANEWSMANLRAEVARPGGMRESPLFIGTGAACEGWIHGCEWGESDQFGRRTGNRPRSEAPAIVASAPASNADAERGVGTLHLKIGDRHVSIQTHTRFDYHDGFSFGVGSELEAFQAAYTYRYRKSVKVVPGPAGWRVAIYRTVEEKAGTA
jgi:hypothetical protein